MIKCTLLLALQFNCSSHDAIVLYSEIVSLSYFIRLHNRMERETMAISGGICDITMVIIVDFGRILAIKMVTAIILVFFSVFLI